MGQSAPMGRQRLRKWPDNYVKLMADYMDDMPLYGTLDWESELALSRGLLDRLLAWQLKLDTNFHYERGWLDEAERAIWSRDAEDLCADLRRELPADIPLVVDLWPIEPSRWMFWKRHGVLIYS